MQETRLNRLIGRLVNQFFGFLTNPWRQLSLIIICALLGFFLASVITTSAGQSARWDITIALFFLLFTETSSYIIYRSLNEKPPWIDLLNSLKIGFVYGLYLESLKLGS
jgi:energy-coupling factor transporter transmembrane protein EcfT